MALPDIDSLRCFVEAARLLNFRAAARAVALTPAALGQRIKKLEDDLGEPLFNRTTRRVILTEAGLALLPVALRTLEDARDCVRAARGELGHVEMDVTVGTRHELGLSWLVPMLPRLRDEHPGVTFHLYFGAGQDLELRTRTQEADCAVTSRRLTDPTLDFFRLHREDYLFVGAPSLLDDTPLDAPEHAARHTLIDISTDLPLFGYVRDAAGAADSLEFARLLRLGTIDAIRTLVLAGEGVGVLPEYLVRPDVDAGRLRRVLPEVEPRHDWFRLIFRRDDPKRALYKAIADTMLEEPLR